MIAHPERGHNLPLFKPLTIAITMSVAEFLSRPLPIAYGHQTLRNRVALAPMAGMTDVPFRTLAWRFGAGHMVSEMVTSKPELWDTCPPCAD